MIKGSNQDISTEDPKLVGQSNETNILINDVRTTALLDTGSCVSVLSESFYEQHLKEMTHIRPLQEIIYIECADGQRLPYLGYIEVDLMIENGFPMSQKQTCLFLVAPDTKYSATTPVILGTNILSELLQECRNNAGEQFLQKANLHVPWYLCFRTMVLREKNLKQSNNRIAIVRSAQSHKVTLGPNKTVTITASTDREADHPETLALLEESKDASIPAYIDVMPGVVQFNCNRRNTFNVTLTNLTNNTAVISPREVLCELQPVQVTEEVILRIEEEELEKKRTQIVEELLIDEDNILTLDQLRQVKDLMMKHKDIFSTSDTDIGLCSSIKHRIDLLDETPFKQKHRRIPPSMIEEIRQHLEQLLACDIIRPSKSPFASNVVLVRKKN